LDIPNGFWPLERAVGRAYIRETVDDLHTTYYTPHTDYRL
jgi:hypothetical protein